MLSLSPRLSRNIMGFPPLISGRCICKNQKTIIEKRVTVHPSGSTVTKAEGGTVTKKGDNFPKFRLKKLKFGEIVSFLPKPGAGTVPASRYNPVLCFTDILLSESPVLCSGLLSQGAPRWLSFQG